MREPSYKIAQNYTDAAGNTGIVTAEFGAVEYAKQAHAELLEIIAGLQSTE